MIFENLPRPRSSACSSSPMRTPSLLVLSSAFLAAITALTAAPTVTLFNGRDLTGWVAYSKEPGSPMEATWSVKDGVIACTGSPTGYIHTQETYSNYRLTAQWRWVPVPDDRPGKPNGRNSGFLVHAQEPDAIWPKAVESQIRIGDAGDLIVIGGVEAAELPAARAAAIAAAGNDAKALEKARISRRIPKQKDVSEKPIGEWNTLEIVCRDNTLSSRINGVDQNLITGVTVSSGQIGLQAEGAPIEFRNIELTPLD